MPKIKAHYRVTESAPAGKASADFLRLGVLKNREPAGGFCERQTVSGFIVDEEQR